jgi:cell wall-associated NlpC family hydrolase
MNYAIAQKKWFLQVVMSYLGAWYRWGGDDPAGIDCSGVVVEGLRAAGMLAPHEDLTADGLWDRYKQRKVMSPGEGCLIFWFNSEGKATHVAVALDSYFCLTADGGGSTIHTVADAEKANAFVKVRPIGHRMSQPKYVDLFTQTIL